MNDEIKKDINKLLQINSYPLTNWDNFQYNIYKKREFYYNKIPELIDVSNKQKADEYINSECQNSSTPKLRLQQLLISNFINPLTPYTGLLLFHGVGTGKTGCCITIAENFKEMIMKYNTKIYVLVPGPIIKETWKKEIINMTGYKYYWELGINEITKENKEIMNNNLKKIINKYYKIISYRWFAVKLFGNKFSQFFKSNNKIEDKLKKMELNFTSFNNTLLIIDEAHNLTGNSLGKIVNYVIERSVNLRIILSTATPMKNSADDIVDLINIIRPLNDKIWKTKIFKKNKKIYELEFTKDGLELLKQYCNGYVSYYRGWNPLLFAKQHDMGIIPKNLLFTYVFQCFMEQYQQKIYKWLSKNVNIDEIQNEEALDISIIAACNFVFPYIGNDKELEFTYGLKGLNKLLLQLNSDNKNFLLNLLVDKFNFDNIDKELILYSTKKNNISGKIFEKKYVKFFSIKFYNILLNLQNIFESTENKTESRTCFIYSNLVKNGIELMESLLINNGYLEFDEKQNYNITDDTIDYRTGLKYSEYKKLNTLISFSPATYIIFVGNSNLNEYVLPEEKKRLLDDVFNHENNIDGKNIKIILGSRIMTEGVTIDNLWDIHILDVHYNLSKTIQVIGRGIRQCRHYKYYLKNKLPPVVNVYKYVSCIMNSNDNWAEESIYMRWELKYISIKQAERALKEIAIDCPLLYNHNVFKNEIIEHKNCLDYNDLLNGKKANKNNEICPLYCDLTTCHYQCDDKKLNLQYYDNTTNIYKYLKIEEIDFSTFNNQLFSNEIKYCSDKIRELFKFKQIYNLDKITNYIYNTLDNNKKKLFIPFFVYKALDDFIPKNNCNLSDIKYIIHDKFNNSGHLIYFDNFYVFKPFFISLKEYVNKQIKYSENIRNDMTVSKYITYLNFEKKQHKIIFTYNYDYYLNRNHHTFFGILDNDENNNEILKIKIIDKSFVNTKKTKNINIFNEKYKGFNIVYLDKKDIQYLLNNLWIEQLNYKKKDIVDIIKNKLLFNEKYSIDKKTFIIIPNNCVKYNFPYNLIDRIEIIKTKFDNFLKNYNLNYDFKFNQIKQTNGIFNNIRNEDYIKYELVFEINKSIIDNDVLLLNYINELGFTFKNTKNNVSIYFILIE